MKSSVIVIIFNETREQLIAIKRRDVPIWVLPGGGIEENETPEEAALREIVEETGLKVSIKRKVAEYTPKNYLAKVTHLFECQYVSGIPHEGTETKEIHFFSYQNLPKPFFFLHQEWLNDALKNEKGIIRKSIEQVTYFRLFLYFCRHPLWVLRLALSRLGLPINSR